MFHHQGAQKQSIGFLLGSDIWIVWPRLGAEEIKS